MEQSTLQQIDTSDEISLVDILCFLQRRFIVIGSLTLLSTLLGFGFAISRPIQIQQTFKLSLGTPVFPDEIQSEPSEGDLMVVKAVSLIQNLGQQEGVSIKSLVYRSSSLLPENGDLSSVNRADEFQVTTIATDGLDLESFPEVVQEGLKAGIEPIINQKAGAALAQLYQETQEVQYVINSLEAAKAEEDFIAAEITKLARLEFQRQGLSQFRASLSSKLEVNFLDVNQAPIKRPLLQTTILGLMAGLMVSIVIGIVIEQWSLMHRELAQEQEQPNQVGES
jgi:hypothetical protein